MLRRNARVVIPGVPSWHHGTVTQELDYGRIVITWDTVRDPETGKPVRSRHEYSAERAEAIERVTLALRDAGEAP